jgi:hypothetical protein
MSGDTTPSSGQAGGLGGTWRKVVAAVNAPGSDDKWWTRYAVAIGMVAVAWYLVELNARARRLLTSYRESQIRHISAEKSI